MILYSLVMYLIVSKNIFNFLKKYIYIVYNFYITNIQIFILILTIITFICFFLYYYTSKYEMPNCPIIICIFTLIMSLIWIWFTANILISLLMAISNMMNINESFLGMTVLTYGNSISDLMLNLSLVKLGYGEMALSGSIAGPLFNLLIGLGIPLLKLNIKEGGIDIDIFNKNNSIGIICLVLLIGNLITLGIQAKYDEYHLKIKLALVRYIFYFLFFAIICLITFMK